MSTRRTFLVAGAATAAGVAASAPVSAAPPDRELDRILREIDPDRI